MAGKRIKKLIFQKWPSVSKILRTRDASKRQKQPFADGVKPLSTSPPERPAKPGSPGEFASPAIVTFASFVYGSLVVIVIAFFMLSGYTCFTNKKGAAK